MNTKRGGWAWWPVAWLGGILGLGVGQVMADPSQSLSLAGSWRFALDPQDVGVEARWFGQELPGRERVRWPGSLQEQGFGDGPTVDTPWMGDLNERSFFTADRYARYRESEHFAFPYWLTPTRYYAGAAWYQREVTIPEAWSGRRVVLELERPHWGTTVWLDGEKVGEGDSLAVPHRFELGTALTPGRRVLTVRVDNRYLVPIGRNSHSISDHTQGNWNGVVGKVTLTTTPRVWIEDVQVYPEVATRSIRVRGRTGNQTGETGQGTMQLLVRALGYGDRSGTGGAVTLPVTWGAEGGVWETRIELGAQAPLWDEFQPALHEVTARLAVEGGGEDHEVQVRFGMREVGVRDRQITVNGRALFLRGTLECAIFPRTGYPPTDVASWRRIMEVARAHGLNHLRFHSWTPPKAAFEAADEAGFYLHVECPTWANFETTIGDGGPVDAWVIAEGSRILREYGNHPSLVLMAYGNEPAGKNHERWLGDLVRRWQAEDGRRLYTSAGGWPMLPENDVHVTPNARAYPVRAKDGDTAGDYGVFQRQQSVPVISHEIGQYCVFPNLAERRKYTGWLQARNFDIVEDFLRQAGMLRQAPAFLRASGRLQVAFYKDEIEACLRTPGWGGFQLLDLRDFPGQGTALVGVLDPFWESKGYVTPEEYRRFCDETVPLARLSRRIWTGGEAFEAEVEIAHFGATDLKGVTVAWHLRGDAGRTVAEGRWEGREVPTGKVTQVGRVEVDALPKGVAEAMNLEVVVVGTRFANDWNLWVFPEAGDAPAEPEGIRVVRQWDAAVESALAAGERVVVLSPPARIAGQTVGRFDPIFWNKMWFPSQPQHTLGLLMDPDHPALAGFPTASHADWQWQDLQNASKPMDLTVFPRRFRPTVQVIDDWNTCRKLGLVVEARVGRGRLLVCSVDLERDLERRPAARQLRRSLLEYAAGPRFDPRTAVSMEQARSLFREPNVMAGLGARVVQVTSEHPGHEAALVIDGDPATLWHTAWGDGAPSFPHALTLRFEREAKLKSMVFQPRQDSNRNGWIRDYTIEVSLDGEQWGEPVARGRWEADALVKEVRLASPTPARWVRFTARSGFGDQPFASLAEIEVAE